MESHRIHVPNHQDCVFVHVPDLCFLYVAHDESMDLGVPFFQTNHEVGTRVN